MSERRPGAAPNETTRRALLGGTLLGTTGLLLGGTALARTPPTTREPDIASTDAWGARPPRNELVLLSRPARKIIVHHTATPNSTDHSRAHAFELARSIQDHHMDHNGWTDTGQHFTLSRGGHITEGRHHSLAAFRDGGRHVVSAHTSGQNRLAVGIENEGTYDNVAFPSTQYDELVGLCSALCTAYAIEPYEIYGHRDFNATGCPGDRLYALLGQLRTDVAASVGGDPTGVSWPLLRSGDEDERVRVLQYLLNEHGATLTTDGIYGPATEGAVRDFQRSTGAIVDGLAGNQTWNQAVRERTYGDSGPAVRAVQHRLGTTVDGVFGPVTESAVRTFQSERGLRGNGVVDARTWDELVG
ncbi:Peptidoglycan-binding (PGRP) domain of peptidoglycan hydrolases-containing protein [Actinopolyspora xinjiangensis]|uniref:Peptidoglycan-binding (PGRP) domain of peptidoglycan hydrolases-containing protein n=1 Tax=Actinopolyspora xinjiangensis TaxID=405564 RepID=A0A1H0Q625_9ACTN|nr:N-acetylmuramoyl-L-alanine amidase [Actinopolyspora xinjiangensis]SDP12842.1 Peptidoglycan-binding (PGRP) domain of peptidoglycan hydrolases-containing protein [Actinopolyspora xinjiangensis]